MDNSAAGRHRPILISGKGRSGSNRLLDIFDASRETACRSEVNEIPGSAFHGIGGTLFPEDLGAGQLRTLQEALPQAVARRSALDRLSQTDKAFLTAAGKALCWPMSRARLRRALRAMRLLRHENEWRFPAICLKGSDLAGARPVLKLNSCPAWAAALARADEGLLIVHNMRDPIDYLQSWYNRLILARVGTSSFEANFGDVPRILGHFGRDDADRLREPSQENLVEVELWRWRYINESIADLASLPGQYFLVTYDRLESDIEGVVRRLYAFAGLALDDRTLSRIVGLKNELFREPHREKLDRDLCDRLAARVLEGSPLASHGAYAPD